MIDVQEILELLDKYFKLQNSSNTGDTSQSGSSMHEFLADIFRILISPSGNLPDSLKTAPPPENMDNQSIWQTFTQDIEKSIPEKSVAKNTEKRISVFETHNEVIIRVLIPPYADESLLRVQMGTNTVIIRWSPYGPEEIIPIHTPVYYGNVSAQAMDHILDVKMHKYPQSMVRRIGVNYDQAQY